MIEGLSSDRAWLLSIMPDNGEKGQVFSLILVTNGDQESLLRDIDNRQRQ